MPRELEEALFAGLAREVAASAEDVHLRKADALRASLTAAQLDLIIDPARRKALRSPRRVGKTFGAAAYLADTNVRQSGAESLYISLTRRTARRLAWRQLLRMDKEYDFRWSFNHTEMIATTRGDGHVTVGGAEDISDIERYRGGQYDLIIIDECKSFAIDLLETMIKEVLAPCLLDRMGTLLIMGTPGAVIYAAQMKLMSMQEEGGKRQVHPFFLATGPEACSVRVMDGKRRVVSRPYRRRSDPSFADTAYQWSLHEWVPQDNTAIPDLWDRMLAEKEMNGWSDEHPYWRREYMGEWVADESALVYRYDNERNGWEPNPEFCDEYGVTDWKKALPDGHDWKFVAGMDLGFDDDFSLEVAAYADTYPGFIHVYDFARSQMTIPDIAAQYREAEARFGSFEFSVGDRGGLGKTILATLQEVYGINVEAADKHEKRDHQELLNADLLSGRGLIMRQSGLANEMSVLQWDLTNPSKPKEDEACENHRCDGFLYIWRHLYHHFWQQKVIAPEVGSANYIQAMEDAAIEKMLEKRRKRQQMEREFWDDGRELDSTEGFSDYDPEVDFDA